MSEQQEIDFGQNVSRSGTAEAQRIYAAVLALRRAGYEVMRVGPKESRINGRLIANRDLERLARRLLVPAS